MRYYSEEGYGCDLKISYCVAQYTYKKIKIFLCCSKVGYDKFKNVKYLDKAEVVLKCLNNMDDILNEFW